MGILGRVKLLRDGNIVRYDIKFTERVLYIYNYKIDFFESLFERSFYFEVIGLLINKFGIFKLLNTYFDLPKQRLENGSLEKKADIMIYHIVSSCFVGTNIQTLITYESFFFKTGRTTLYFAALLYCKCAVCSLNLVRIDSSVCPICTSYFVYPLLI